MSQARRTWHFARNARRGEDKFRFSRKMPRSLIKRLLCRLAQILGFKDLLIGLDSVFQSLKGGFRFLAFIRTTDILSAVGI